MRNLDKKLGKEYHLYMDQMKQKGFSMPIGIAIILMMGSIGLGTLIGSSYFQKKPVLVASRSPSTKSITINTKSAEKWLPFVSSVKAFPIVDKVGKLWLYKIAENKLIDTDLSADWGGSSKSLGQNDPLVSPDMHYTAYLDPILHNLWIISHQTLEKRMLSESPVQHITAWSPSSRKVLYNISEDTVVSRKEGPYIEPTKNEIFDPNLTPGMFLFDLDTGSTLRIAPLTGAEAFIDDNTLLFESQDMSELKMFTNDFSLSTFTARYRTASAAHIGLGQYHFAPDGKYWTFTYSKNPTDDASVVFAEYPNLQGITIDSGGWADVQTSTFSPTGKKIAYVKRDGYISPGYPRSRLTVYDRDLQNKISYEVVSRYWWVDDEHIIFQTQEDYKDTDTVVYKMLDLSNGSTKQIYPKM